MKSKLGFTLVELLIVISLIAILSVAVIATIDPVEQANKARDAQYQNDAAELLNAYDRYFVSTGKYPWEIYGPTYRENIIWYPSIFNGFGICSDGNYGLDYDMYRLTACSSSNSSTFGPLITSGELKSSFLNKDFIQKTLGGISYYESIIVLKEINSDKLNFCYIPKSKSNRSQTTKLKCFNNDDTPLQPVNGTCTAPTINSISWTDDPFSLYNQAVWICVSN